MRKELDITISDGNQETNRDYGKTFHIREMSASRAEKWAMRALLAAARSGVELPEGFAGGGMQSIAILGIQAILKMNFYDAEPLLDEMMECVRIKPDSRNPSVVRDLIEDDVEEITTLIKLREEVIKLHIGFFGAGSTLKQGSAGTSPPDSSTTPTFPEPSVQFSQQGKPR